MRLVAQIGIVAACALAVAATVKLRKHRKTVQQLQQVADRKRQQQLASIHQAIKFPLISEELEAAICSSTVVELRAGLDSGKYTSEQIVLVCIHRLRTKGVELNAIFDDLFDEALAQARQCDEQRAKGTASGLLHGIPISVKEHIQVKGTASAWGHAALSNDIAATDNLFIKGLRKQGAIIICTSSMQYGAWGMDCSNNIVGLVTNPLNPKRSPGGSSGGDAALVASHCVPIGLGSDIGGSIRVPANYCGLFGHKSTETRLPDSRNDRRAFPGLQGVWGPIARSAEDLVLVLKSVLVSELYNEFHT